MWLRRISSDGRSVTSLAARSAGFEPIHVVGHLAELDDVPSVGAEALGDVVVVRQRGVAVDRDVVVVVDADQLAEPEVAGERGRLVRDALHEAPVAGDHVRVMVDRLRAEVGGRKRSAIAMPTALPKP